MLTPLLETLTAKNVIMMKGAPEIVLTKCSRHLHNRTEKDIDEVG